MSRKMIVLGAGGHAKVLIDALTAAGQTVGAVVDTDPSKRGHRVLGVEVVGDDSWVLQQKPGDVLLVNGLGSISSTALRAEVFGKFKARGYEFASVVHPSATVSKNAALGEGAQVLAGAVIQPGVQLGHNVLINTRASVDHDCVVGDHVHIAPGAVLSGEVKVGAGAHLGTGCCVIQGVRVGQKALIGAGAVVVSSISDGAVALGIPAQERGKA